MVVKTGCVVSHAVATQWGVGKVMECNDVRATIQFNDGMIRKIISSHYIDLQPADPASYVAPTVSAAPKLKAVKTTTVKKATTKKATKSVKTDKAASAEAV